MAEFMTQMVEEKSFLNNLLNKLKQIIDSEEFASYLTASGLTPPEVVKKGYPNLDSSSIKQYEAYINTSTAQNCLVWDIEDGVDCLAIVDIYLPDNALKYIWKYADATMQWLWQFNLKSLTIVDFNARIYSKASGDSANHFTLSIHTLGDKFIDKDTPNLVEEE